MFGRGASGHSSHSVPTFSLRPGAWRRRTLRRRSRGRPGSALFVRFRDATGTVGLLPLYPLCRSGLHPHRPAGLGGRASGHEFCRLFGLLLFTARKLDHRLRGKLFGWCPLVRSEVLHPPQAGPVGFFDGKYFGWGGLHVCNSRRQDRTCVEHSNRVIGPVGRGENHVDLYLGKLLGLDENHVLDLGSGLGGGEGDFRREGPDLPGGGQHRREVIPQ